MDTKEESSRLLTEATEDRDRASRYSRLRDWVTVIHYSQLAIEKSAKALISCFEAFEWTHDPSGQLRRLVEKGLLKQDFLELASYAKEAAPWHGRSTYDGWRESERMQMTGFAGTRLPSARGWCYLTRNLDCRSGRGAAKSEPLMRNCFGTGRRWRHTDYTVTDQPAQSGHPDSAGAAPRLTAGE